MSCDSMEWATPQKFFDELDKEFHFTLDPCASRQNHKCDKYFTIRENGLAQDWSGENVFMNPPYGNESIKWVAKAYFESQKPDTLIVGLLPARTDTKWFHGYIYGKAEIRFIKNRLYFIRPDGISGRAPFPSMVVVWE